MAALRLVWATVADTMPALEQDAAEVDELLDKAVKYGSEEYDMARAQHWALDFDFPQDVWTRHIEELQASGLSLEGYIERKQEELRENMISPARFSAAIAPYRQYINDDDYRRGLEIAQGIQVPTAPEFVERTEPGPFRRKYKEGKAAIHKLTYKQYEDGTLLAFPTDQLQPFLHGVRLHYNDVNWAANKGKESGRLICDHSYSEGGCHLNGSTPEEKKSLRTILDAEWGAVVLATLICLCLMILKATDKSGWAGTVLFSKDVKKAFNQLFFAVRYVRLFAVAMIGGLTTLHLVGNFGWTGLPNAWGVISRILLALAMAMIRATTLDWDPALLIYVDDFCGATGTTWYAGVSAAINGAITTLLGPFGLAAEKDRSGRNDFAMLGWAFDLDSRMVGLAEPNLLKTICSALSISTAKGAVHRLTPLQSLASRMSRAACLSPVMKTFTVSIYRDIGHFKGDKKKRRCISATTRADITLWRAFLVLMGTRRTEFCRPIESFRPLQQPTIRIEFDGSLFGLGVVVSDRVDATEQFELLAFASIFPIPFKLDGNDSSYQNSTELAAATAGILIALSRGHRNFTFQLSGDSVTVLRWIEKGRVNSCVARRMATGFALASVVTGAILHETTFIKGKDNVLCDELSRGIRHGLVASLDPTKEVFVDANHLFHEYLRHCDPMQPCESVAENTALCASLCNLLARIKPGLKPPATHST